MSVLKRESYFRAKYKTKKLTENTIYLKEAVFQIDIRIFLQLLHLL